MRTRRTGKRKEASGRMSKVARGVISPRSLEILDHSAANLKKGLASVPVAKPKKRVRLGALKGLMEIKGDIIHSDIGDDLEDP
jgi:hypothetical protein